MIGVVPLLGGMTVDEASCGGGVEAEGVTQICTTPGTSLRVPGRTHCGCVNFRSALAAGLAFGAWTRGLEDSSPAWRRSRRDHPAGSRLN